MKHLNIFQVLLIIISLTIYNNTNSLNIYESDTLKFNINFSKVKHENDEALAYNLLKKIKTNKKVNYLAIPWQSNLKEVIKEKIFNKLPNLKLNEGFTIFNPPHYEKVALYLKNIGINVIFSPHATKAKKYKGITILPFPISASQDIKPKANKDILYSFIGAVTHPVRKKIFNLPKDKDAIIKKRRKFHYFFISNKEKESFAKEYKDILSRTRFSLCPRGYGPGTIRFWESLNAGAIPVLISDKIELPDSINWDQCIIRVLEKDIKKIPAIIKSISLKKEQAMRNNCLEAYKQLSNDNIIKPIKDYYNLS